MMTLRSCPDFRRYTACKGDIPRYAHLNGTVAGYFATAYRTCVAYGEL